MNPRVKFVNPTNNYQLMLEFTNGEWGVYDCKHLLNDGAYQAWRDIDYFRQVTVADGTLKWPQQQTINPDTLYLDSHKQ
ncbi:MAG: DUF2442 domain-containing protein [Methylococcaceae bacterium]|nr:DUF2442 domain-containing protein [Methylococcaceae bacterium]